MPGEVGYGGTYRLNYIKLMFFAMVPVIELRGAIPIGIAMNLNPMIVYIFCLIGSTIVSIPIILLFRSVIEFFRQRIYFNKIVKWVDLKVDSKVRKLKKTSIIGLILFVGIPLPTTGSWSAAAIASVLKMRIKDAVLGIFLGNVVSGIIVLFLALHII